MAENTVDEGNQPNQTSRTSQPSQPSQSSQDPLVAALPPATDYLTYLTLLEYQLKPSNLSTLNRLLCEDDGKLVEEIGWDLLRLVLPMLHAAPQEASNCVQIITKRGNPREVVLRVAEEFEKLRRDDEEDEEVDHQREEEEEQKDDDDDDDNETSTFSGEAPRVHLGRMSLDGLPKVEQSATETSEPGVQRPFTDHGRDRSAQKLLVFQELLGALTPLHRRIKTKYPSRFLATSLPAALGAFRTLPITIETTTAFLKCLGELSSSHRPPLPPRTSSVEIHPSSMAHLPDPEAVSEAHGGSNVASDNEKAIIKRLLQAVLVEIVDDYLSSLQHDECPTMRWTCRLREKVEPGRSIPGKETERERWQKDSALRARDSLVEEFTKLSRRLGLDATKQLRVAIGQDKAPEGGSNNSEEEEFEYPVTPSQVPFAVTGLIQLAAASAFTSAQSSETDELSVNDLNMQLAFNSVQTLSSDAVIPLPSVQDALCSILYRQLNASPDPSNSSLLSSITSEDYKTLMGMLTQSFTIGQDAQTRDDTHHVTTKLLHRRQSEADRVETIKQTIRTWVPRTGKEKEEAIALCPPYLEGTVGAIGVDWLKDEILSRVGRATTDANDAAPGLDPLVLERDSELGRLIAPDITGPKTGGTVDPDTTTSILLSLPLFISILNLACILFTRTTMNRETGTFKRLQKCLGSIQDWRWYLVQQISVDEAVRDSASDIFALEDACGRAEAVLGKAEKATVADS